ncbi:rhomboid family intramembrane serine protease [Amycolatopsis sp. DG1A-15b]|uniref:rhomboid family intramembrane serine protease n=1 Tax=Amycolatopsis sp. DG1A-15b TaxID=3052846 RepID=UPI00255BF87F|nr:rhomboid family intramembrane serine protease [Amycolatopsis sp. DG1A-15b]WIX87570.1 rhomboid family intramembrane serine protease [Amycolatopsis sp. DG1A-15b]
MTTRAAPRNPFGALAPVARRPYLTAVVFAVTLACGIAQLVHPPLYDVMHRDAARIDAGEWYRLVTGMFFQDGWAFGLTSNLLWLAFFGTLAERVFGRARWLVLYFGCGLFGQVMSYVWLNPVGAGNSMCVVGLIGGLAAVVMVASRRYGVALPMQFRVIAYAAPVLAVVDTLAHDNHGLPLLLGLALGFALLPAPVKVAQQ